MKKLFFASALCLAAIMSNAQAPVLDEAMLKQQQKDKTSSDQAILDEKKKLKAQTWLDRGKLYDGIAQRYVSLDSNASMVAYDAFKKVVELEAAKPGKATKDAQKYLTNGVNDEGVNLYGSLVKNGAEKFQSKNYENALKYFVLAQEIKPIDTLAPLYGSYAAMQSQKNDIAAQQMEKYITAGGKDGGNFALLAGLYRMAKNNDKALEVLDKGMKAVPASTSAFKAERVNILLDAGRTDEAIVGLKELTELEPKNPQYVLNTGILHDNAANQITTEIRKLQDAGKRGVTNARKLKEAQETDKVFVDELKRISDAMKKQPKNADLKRQKTETEGRQKENKAIIEQLNTDLDKDKAEIAKLGDVTGKIAELTTKRNEKLELAKAAYNKALTIDAKSYDALYNMGVFYFNEAVELKKVVDGMDMKEYSAKGKELEPKVCGKFKQALNYFLKAKETKEEEVLMENIKNAEGIVKQFEEKKVACEESK